MSKKLRAICLALSTAALAVTPSVLAADALTTTVRPLVAFAPATVRVTVRLAPDDRNREITVELDSAIFYRSSTRTVSGSSDARVHEFAFPSVPSGTYEVRSRVARSDGTNAMTRGSLEVVDAGR